MSIRDPKPKYEQPASTFNRPTAIEIIKQIRDAGLDAWDSIPDPEAYLQEMRGYRQIEIDRLTAELAQANDARVIANRANAELRRVLERVEFSYDDQLCPACYGCEVEKHDKDCPLGRALNRPECGEKENE